MANTATRPRRSRATDPSSAASSTAKAGTDNGTAPAPAGDQAPQTDAELVEAAVEAFTSVIPVGLDPAQASASVARMARTAARQPGAAYRRGLRLAIEQARIAAGLSEVEPDPKDRRFGDDWFTTNPVYKRMAQSYVAWNREVHGLIDDLDLDERSKLRPTTGSATRPR